MWIDEITVSFICRPGFLPKITCWIFGNPKNVSGWRYFSLFSARYIRSKLTNPLNTSLSKCFNLLCRKSWYFRLLLFSNVPGIISLILLKFIYSFVNFVSPLNAPNYIVLSSHHPTCSISSAVRHLETKLPLSDNVMLLWRSPSTRTSVRRIKGTVFNDVL